MVNALPSEAFAMVDFPRALIEFQRRFPDDAASAAHLAETRWPEGFVCPECSHGKAWRLDTKAWT
jgi:Transposase zinc-ribbon domain